ncbi:GNAT family N-acetyltransferase [Jeotgalibacillus soli]|uniref:N-acetyltransferase domain-containing protein n=1 Tax=Jeotgalibacillus soli TaxID=889306 RepID=A0A0C2W074_9BACL|nr:GNAT family N-acetyltransferase [Jeotgalibacillus soli]KIL49578.1 hypothetical protein KP78_10460 [Jeotgalibacillus soli]
MINLKKYNGELHRKSVENFMLPPEQAAFTAHPKEALEACKIDPARLPMVVESNEGAVGFFVLHKGDGPRPYTKDPNAILLRAFSIDYHEQGKGYATMAMQEVVEFVRSNDPAVSRIVLGVNLQNKHAQRVYEKAGFIDTGEQYIGKHGPQHIFSYRLKKE